MTEQRVATPLPPEDALDALLDRFQVSASRPMLVDAASGRVYTYAEAWSRGAALAATWAAQGAAPGDSVALVLRNAPEVVFCYLACLIGGYVAIPVNPELAAEDIDYILGLTAPRLVLRDTPILPDDVAEVRPDTVGTAPSAVCAIFFTSGTTGRPKGVRHSLRAMVGNVQAFNALVGLDSRTALYHVLPMTYMAGFLNTVLSPIMAGGRIIIGPRFTPQAALDFWSAPRRHGATAMWLTPSIAATLQRFVRDTAAARANAAGFSQIFCGTAPLHKAVRESFAGTFGRPLQESYGTSELLLIAAQTQADLAAPDSVGQLLSGVELGEAIDGDGNRELVVRSPYAYLGYLTGDGPVAPDMTDASFIRTGDIGETRDDRLVISGRLKDLIIRGGVNVAPTALENALSDIEGVADIAVIGLPHPFWGESIVVCVEAVAGTDTEALTQALRQTATERLGKAQQPDRFEIMASLPRAVTGKVQKAALRAALAP